MTYVPPWSPHGGTVLDKVTKSFHHGHPLVRPLFLHCGSTWHHSRNTCVPKEACNVFAMSFETIISMSSDKLSSNPPSIHRSPRKNTNLAMTHHEGSPPYINYRKSFAQTLPKYQISCNVRVGGDPRLSGKFTGESSGGRHVFKANSKRWSWPIFSDGPLWRYCTIILPALLWILRSYPVHMRYFAADAFRNVIVNTWGSL